MKLVDVVNANEAIKVLIEKPMKVKTSFKIGLFVDKMDPVMKRFDEKRQELFKKFGTQEGERISISPENASEFSSEMNDLLGSDIDATFSLDLADIEDIEIEAKYVLMLKPFIKGKE